MTLTEDILLALLGVVLVFLVYMKKKLSGENPSSASVVGAGKKLIRVLANQYKKKLEAEREEDLLEAAEKNNDRIKAIVLPSIRDPDGSTKSK